jgi:hypothetical protein
MSEPTEKTREESKKLYFLRACVRKGNDTSEKQLHEVWYETGDSRWVLPRREVVQFLTNQKNVELGDYTMWRQIVHRFYHPSDETTRNIRQSSKLGGSLLELL